MNQKTPQTLEMIDLLLWKHKVPNIFLKKKKNLKKNFSF